MLVLSKVILHKMNLLQPNRERKLIPMRWVRKSPMAILEFARFLQRKLSMKNMRIDKGYWNDDNICGMINQIAFFRSLPSPL